MIFVFYRPRNCTFNLRNPRFYACDYDDCKYAFNDTMNVIEIHNFLLMNLQKMDIGDVLLYDDGSGLYLHCSYPVDYRGMTNVDYPGWRRRLEQTKLMKNYILIDPEKYSTLSEKKNEIVSTNLQYKQRGMAWVKKLEILKE